MRLYLGDHGMHPVYDPGEVDGRLDRSKPDSVRMTHAVRRARGRDQALAGNAARPQTVTAGPVAVDQGHARADAGGNERRDEPRAATLKDHQVVAIDHVRGFPRVCVSM